MQDMKALCFSLAFVLAGGMVGCRCRQAPATDGDMAMVDLSSDDPGPITGYGDGPTACGDYDPTCAVVGVGPGSGSGGMFPLPSDSTPPDNVTASNVGRDSDGYLVLDSTHSEFAYLWIADDHAYEVGMVSKVDTHRRVNPPMSAKNQGYSEVARYVSVTCRSGSDSSKWGNKAYTLTVDTVGTCAAGVGCCDANSTGRLPTAIQLKNNRPSRTTVDLNGDTWVSNRAFCRDQASASEGADPANDKCNGGALDGQSSVTKIANAIENCVERNGKAGIQTSSDIDGDGIITTDCNDDGIPDDIATVAATPCKPGHVQEFYGLDDECILFTTNTGGVGGIPDLGGWGRALALQPKIEAAPTDASDAWAGRYHDGAFLRIDGTTGQILQVVTSPLISGKPVHPYGAAIDEFGILWAPEVHLARLYYFNTADATQQGTTAPSLAPTGGGGFYGVALDGYYDAAPGLDGGIPDGGVPDGGANSLVQQVWLGHWGSRNSAGNVGAFRYRPDRTSFATLGNGQWVQFIFDAIPTFSGNNYPAGRGVAVDNRNPAWAWVGLDGDTGRLAQIRVDTPYSAMPIHLSISATTATTGAYTIGVGVAPDLDLWAVNQASSTLTHFAVDSAGNVTAPMAAIDEVKLDDNIAGFGHSHTLPKPYTYSDFTGFGLRNFTAPRGVYTWTQPGCGGSVKTRWLKVVWDDDAPMGTALSVRVRSSDTNNFGGATFTGNYTTSPADLSQAPPTGAGPVMPNPSNFLQIEFDFSSLDHISTPRLKSFQVLYECPAIVP